MIELLSQKKFREKFNDEQFKEIVKQARDRNKNLFGAYESYKIFNDDHELQKELRQLLKVSNIANNEVVDMSFENKHKQEEVVTVINTKKITK